MPGYIPKILLADVKIWTDRGGVDCMSNGPDTIVMEHVPTGTTVFTEYRDKSNGAFYKGYLLAKLETLLRGEG